MCVCLRTLPTQTSWNILGRAQERVGGNGWMDVVQTRIKKQRGVFKLNSDYSLCANVLFRWKFAFTLLEIVILKIFIEMLFEILSLGN